MLRYRVQSNSILLNEDGETEDERFHRIIRETFSGEHTEAFSKFVSRFVDFHAELLHYVAAMQNDAALGQQVRLHVEAFVSEFAADEAENV